MREWADTCFNRLLRYIRERAYGGYDPFDGLNSRILKLLLIDRVRPLARIAQQIVKRSPFNLRPLFLVPKKQNPKSLALCLSALCHHPNSDSYTAEAVRLTDKLIATRSPGWDPPCWGYNFRWESRLFSLPAFSPNAICTVFAGEALLDAWLGFGLGKCREMAEGAAEFLITHLNVTEHESGRCFSYTTIDHSATHNVNLLVSAFLARAAEELERPQLLENLQLHIDFTLAHQRQDGSWPYGEDPGNEWVDGIHQGFNLLALESLRRFSSSRIDDLDRALKLGFRYYLENLFGDDYLPKYYDQRTYPLDSHTFAVALITLARLSHLDDRAEQAAEKVLNHGRNLLWLERKGLFAYRKHRYYRIRTPFMRWSQCWMLYALAEYLHGPQTDRTDLSLPAVQ